MSTESTLDSKALKTNENIASRNYWKQRMAGVAYHSYFDQATGYEEKDKGNFRQYSIDMPLSLYEELSKMAASQKAKQVVLLSVLGILAHKASFKNDILLFTPAPGKEGEEPGIIPVRLNRSFATTFQEFLLSVKNDLVSDFSHSRYPLEKMIDRTRVSSGVGLLIDEQESVLVETLPCTLLFSFFTAAPFRLTIGYDAARFNQAVIQLLAKMYVELLTVFVTNRTYNIAGIDLVELEAAKGIADMMGRSTQNRLLTGQPIAASWHQERLWFIDKFESGFLYNGSPVYHNIPLLLSCEKDTDKELLEKSIRLVLERHTALSTTVITLAEKPFQRIIVKPAFNLQVQEGLADSDAAHAWIRDEIARPFRIDELLFRAVLIQTNERSLLLLVVHHLVADRFSLQQAGAEIMSNYTSLLNATYHPLPAPALPYHRFSTWQQQDFSALTFNYIAFWKDYLGRKMTVLEFPTDTPRAAIHVYEPATIQFPIPPTVVELLQSYQAESGTDTGLLLMAAFTILLSKYARQEEVVIGTSADNRDHSLTRELIGPVANLLPLRSVVNPTDNFIQYLAALQQSLGQVMKYKAIPFDKLVKELAPEKDMSRTALFDILFEYRKDEPGLPVADPAFDNLGYGKYDLNLLIRQRDNVLTGNLVYNKLYFDPATISLFVQYYCQLLQNLLQQPDTKLEDVELIGDVQKKELLEELDENRCVSYPEQETLVTLFAKQVMQQPDAIAIGYEDSHMTYQELDRLTTLLAGVLRRNGVQPDQPVGLLTDRSMDTIIGMLAILKAGGAYLPVDIDYPPARINYMIEDSRMQIMLTISKWKTGVPPGLLTVCIDEETGEAGPDEELTYISRPEHLCYIIYTSGTTGNPKGVMVEHRQVVRLLFNDKPLFDFGPQDVWTMFHSHCFDFSVWEIYGALLYGGKVVVIPRMIARDTSAFRALLIKEKVTVLNQTPSAFYNLVEEELQQEEPGLFLRYVIFGGEALSPGRLKKWHARYPATKLVNMYGITETTVHVTYKDIGTDEIEGNISNIGKPIPTLAVYMLDEGKHLVPKGITGEMYVGGSGVTRGYLGKEELTREKFIPDPYHAGGRLYRTGDLARLISSGDLEYIGRADQQVQLRGFRIEMAEIEHRLAQHESIQDAVVICKGQEEDKYLAAYYTSNRPIPSFELKKLLAESLPDYMIPSVFVHIREIPLTSNGKVDKKGLPDPVLNNQEEHIVATGTVQEKLVTIWSEILAIDKDLISVNRSFFEIGGHSLKAIGLLNRIFKEFGVKIPLKDIFNYQDIAGLSLLIEDGAATDMPKIPKASPQPYYPLSAGQRRLYFLHAFDEGSLAYNMPHVFQLAGTPEPARMRRAVELLVRRHESLRTTFRMVAGSPVQVIGDGTATQLETIRTNGRTIEEIIQTFIRPFNLESGPLLRIQLVQTDTANYLLTDMHHIISDGISQSVMIRDFITFYSGDEPSPLALQYKDYAVWQQSGAEQARWLQDKAFWLEQFKTGISDAELPLDHIRPLVRNYAGDRITFSYAQAGKLQQAAQEEGATLFMLLLSVYATMIARLCNNEDVVIGTPASGRGHADIEAMIGMFVNTLPLRNEVKATYTFRELLRAVKTQTIDCFEHQLYQYEELVSTLELPRDTGRNPLFDVMFVYQNFDQVALSVPGLEFVPYNNGHQPVKFDLLLTGGVTGNGELLFDLSYATALFDRSTAERFTGYFTRLLDAVAQNMDQPLYSINMLADTETELLAGYNNTETPYDRGSTVVSILRKQAKETPAQVAVRYAEENISYEELDTFSDRVAVYLRQEAGIGAGDLVGLLLEREAWLPGYIYGILKAGAAYVPMDPQHPAERLQGMMEDAGLKAILTRTGYQKNEVKWTGRLIDLDAADKLIENMPTAILPPEPLGSDLAYVIYTSGSTGKPKGVMIEHHSVINRLAWMQQQYPLTAEDVLLQKTPLVFDVSVWELFWWSWAGASLCILQPGEEKDPLRLTEVIASNNISVIHFVPSMLHVFLSSVENGSEKNKQVSSLRRVFASGEALKPEQVNQFAASLHTWWGTELINLYGPTEATVDVTYYNCLLNGHEREIPIGRPINNTQVFVLDERGKICGHGITGELWLGGVGLARGYLNNRKLTEERFIHHEETGRRLYRTGDLARWRSDGELLYIGRADGQVKLRGQRLETGEVEYAVNSHEAISENAVVLREVQGEPALVCYYVSKEGKQADEPTLRFYLEGRLPGYMIPSYFVKLLSLPLTGNGKLDRRGLPIPDTGIEHTEQSSAADEREAKLVEIWAEVLHLPASQISYTKSFFEQGGHSLRAMMLTSKLLREFGVAVPLQKIFESKNIRSLSRYIAGAESSLFSHIAKTEKKEYYVLSPTQKAIYFLHEYDKDSLAYNMPRVLKIEGKLNKDRLRESFEQLIERHEILRTRFEVVNDEPVQLIADRIDFRIEYFQAKEEEVRSIMEALIRPFDLKKAPLIRVGLIEINPQEHFLMVDTHHIAMDGTSNGVLIREFTTLYNKEENLPPVQLSYKDYAEWKDSAAHLKKIARQKEFWNNEFSDGIPVLELPTDFERPLIKSQEGATIDFTIGAEDTARIKGLAEKESATLYMVLLSAYYIMLSKLSGQEDIVVGTSLAGREHDDLKNMMGIFLATLPLRNTPRSGMRYADFLRSVKERTVACFENQAYQYEGTGNHGSFKRDVRHNALFDVMFMVQNYEKARMMIPDLNFIAFVREGEESKFDLTLTAVENNGELFLNFEYCSKLFREETIRRFIGYYKKIVLDIIADTDILIADIKIITPAEENEILTVFNQPIQSYEGIRTIVDHFEEQVAQQGSRACISFKESYWTYSQLNRQVNQLCHYLVREKNVKKGDVVALFLNRTPDMIVSLLAVLKAGATYLPLDPNNPVNRLNYILADAGAGHILADMEDTFLDTVTAQVILLAKEKEQIDEQPVSDPGISLSLSGLAYLIYTSGSTGRPKGVMISHRALLDYTLAFRDYYGVDKDDKVIQQASLSFDTAVEEIFPTLAAGGQLILLPDGSLDTEYMLSAINKEKATILSTTPLVLSELNQRPDELEGLRVIISGGDTLLYNQVDKLIGRYALYNTYGPSETTVCATYGRIEKAVDVSSIGRPIRNRQIVILDKEGALCPKLVGGELCVAGTGVAEGYLNNEKLTSEKFAPHAYSGREKTYRTGDRARWLPDGSIEFLGRMDGQVKIRGARIESGEIENQLLSYPAIREAAVTVIENKEAGLQLCAYYVASETVQTAELKEYIRRELPEYMIPFYFMQLEQMPLTVSGKIDKKALPSPADRPDAGNDYVHPRNNTEQRLAAIWKELLEIDKVGINDNFFDLGGHSLKALTLIHRIQKEFRKEVPLREIFRTPTIRSIALFLSQKKIHTMQEETGEQAATVKTDTATNEINFDMLDEHILVLNRNESDTTIFILPGTGGLSDGYFEIAKAFGNSCSVFGLHMMGTQEGDTPLDTVREIASQNIRWMQQVQPQGPYRLMGHSFGGNIVYEMALQLEKAGQEVAFVAILDAWAGLRGLILTEENKVNFVMGLSGDYYRDFNIVADPDPAWVSELGAGLAPLPVKNMVPYVAGFLKNKLEGRDERIDFVARLINLQLHNTQMVYKPGESIQAEMIVFKSGSTPEDTDKSMGWNLFSDKIQLVDLPGNHDMVNKENISTVVACLQEKLAATSAEATQ